MFQLGFNNQLQNLWFSWGLRKIIAHFLGVGVNIFWKKKSLGQVNARIGLIRVF